MLCSEARQRANAFSVRWGGFIRPHYDQTYTFKTRLADPAAAPATDQRVKLWVDGALVIDQWTSLFTSDPSGTFYFDHREILYDIRIEMTGGVNEPKMITLMWESALVSRVVEPQTVPSLRLFRAYHIVGSPFAVAVTPNKVSAAHSTTSGDISDGVLPSGSHRTLFISLRDEFGNARDTPAAFTAMHVDGVVTIVVTPENHYGELSGLYYTTPITTFADTVHVGTCTLTGSCSNVYGSTYTVSAGARVMAHAALRGGLNATYHRGTILRGSVLTRIDPTIDFSRGRSALPGTSADELSVRWSGYVRATIQAEYTFKVVSSPTIGTFTFAYDASIRQVRSYFSFSLRINGSWVHYWNLLVELACRTFGSLLQIESVIM